VFTNTEANTIANYAYADCYRDAKSYSHAHSDSTPNTVANHAYTDCYRDAKSYPHAQANTAASSHSAAQSLGLNSQRDRFAIFAKKPVVCRSQTACNLGHAVTSAALI
jgi:hypothetical protein